MKKVLSLILALVMCLSLCACGGTSNGTEPTITEPTITEPTEKELKDLVVGTWIREYTFDGKSFVTTINIYKGGTGTFQTEDDYSITDYIGGEEVPDSTTWEIVDDVLNIEIAGDGLFTDNTIMGFVYSNEEAETLQTVDGTKTYYRQAE